MNRSLPFIEAIDRESEHKRRCDRVTRSREMYNAALIEANNRDAVLIDKGTHYQLFKGSLRVWFYPCTNSVFAMWYGEYRSRKVEVTAEVDVYDVLILFLDGVIK